MKLSGKVNRLLAGGIFAMMLSNDPSTAWSVGASGFSTQFVGAKAMGQGNVFVAEADDPSAIYYNPAGMTQLEGTQISAGITALEPITDRTGDGVPDDQMKRQWSELPNFFFTSSIPISSRSEDNRLFVGIG